MIADFTGRTLKPGDYFVFSCRSGSWLWLQYGRIVETRKEMRHGHASLVAVSLRAYNYSETAHLRVSARPSVIERTDRCVLIPASAVPANVRAAIAKPYRAAVHAVKRRATIAAEADVYQEITPDPVAEATPAVMPHADDDPEYTDLGGEG